MPELPPILEGHATLTVVTGEAVPLSRRDRRQPWKALVRQAKQLEPGEALHLEFTDPRRARLAGTGLYEAIKDQSLRTMLVVRKEGLHVYVQRLPEAASDA